MSQITKEFPEGKEAYCPKCYFEDNKVVLREECPHNEVHEMHQEEETRKETH